MGSEMCKGQSQPQGFTNPQNDGLPQKFITTTIHQDNSKSSSANNETFLQPHAEAVNEQQKKQTKIQSEEKTQFPEQSMSAAKICNQVRYDDLHVIKNLSNRKRINQFEMEVPFHIIFLTITPGLRHTIHAIGKDLFQKYYEDQQHSGWKLHKNGYYINYLAKKLTAVMTQTVYFEGELEEEDKILPKSDGILMNEFGRYEGRFQKGKANGKGTFQHHINKVYYKGVWENGKMIDGLLEGVEYNFKGKIKDSCAHGEAELYFKQVEVSYVGKFKKGSYHDQKAIYETKDYVYEGGFVNGMKHGQGTLVQKQRNYRDKKVKYRPPDQYEGQFSKDVYLNKEAHDQELQGMRNQEGNIPIQEKPILELQDQHFEEKQETAASKSKIDAAAVAAADEQFYLSKPKFIWVEPPKPPKKHKKSRAEMDEEF